MLPPGLPPGLIHDVSALYLAYKAEKKKSAALRKYKCTRAWMLRQADGSYRRTQARLEAAAFLATHGFCFVDLVAATAAPAPPADAEIAHVCTSTPAVGQSKRVRPTPADKEDFDGRTAIGTC